MAASSASHIFAKFVQSECECHNCPPSHSPPHRQSDNNLITPWHEWFSVPGTFRDRNLLVAFNQGDVAKQVELKSDSETLADGLAALADLFPNRVPIPRPSEIRITRWSMDPFSFGSYRCEGKRLRDSRLHASFLPPCPCSSLNLLPLAAPRTPTPPGVFTTAWRQTSRRGCSSRERPRTVITSAPCMPPSSRAGARLGR
jgi:hypothetical protein